MTQMTDDVVNSELVSKALCGRAANDELEPDAAHAQDFRGKQQKIDSLFALLSHDEGDDGNIRPQLWNRLKQK